jgi:hypothetical protein
MTTNSTQGAMVTYHPVASSSSDAYALVNATSVDTYNVYANAIIQPARNPSVAEASAAMGIRRACGRQPRANSAMRLARHSDAMNVINTTNGDANSPIPYPWRVKRVHSVEHATTLVEADVEQLAHRRPYITSDGTIADLAARS